MNLWFELQSPLLSEHWGIHTVKSCLECNEIFLLCYESISLLNSVKHLHYCHQNENYNAMVWFTIPSDYGTRAQLCLSFTYQKAKKKERNKKKQLIIRYVCWYFCCVLLLSWLLSYFLFNIWFCFCAVIPLIFHLHHLIYIFRKHYMSATNRDNLYIPYVII